MHRARNNASIETKSSNREGNLREKQLKDLVTREAKIKKKLAKHRKMLSSRFKIGMKIKDGGRREDGI